MAPSESVDDDQFFGGRRGVVALAVAYVSVGLGLVYSLATGSIDLFSGVLVAIVVVVGLSLYILYKREGLMTAENRLIGIFVLIAMGLLFGLLEFTDLPSEIVYGIVFAVGVVVPGLLRQYTDYGSD
ncbi:hypothetical protein [Halorussus lipolyticus]|uniref:hypothetical protein n=1 Tax=Halorussus lipolyticus TaxID=3034024 RepID=UPI0023E8AC12|nr:hypothetical protein [Halorussus sp. DT80]